MDAGDTKSGSQDCLASTEQSVAYVTTETQDDLRQEVGEYFNIYLGWRFVSWYSKSHQADKQDQATTPPQHCPYVLIWVLISVLWRLGKQPQLHVGILPQVTLSLVSLEMVLL